MESKPKTYILRWNPDISNFKLNKFRDIFKESPDEWFGSWSVYEYKQAREGDHFYMVRVGKGNTGVVFRGEFSSDPYEDEDWAGTDKVRHYVDFVCFYTADPDQPAPITINDLEQAIPEIDWQHGHSGVLLTDEQAEKLNELWENNVGELDWYDDYEDDEDDEEDDRDAPFNADPGHNSHFNCIDTDTYKTMIDVVNLIAEKRNVEELPYDAGANDGIKILSTDDDKAITVRAMFKGKKLLSLFPYAVNDKPTTLTLRKIDEYSNGLEAVLTCTYNNKQKIRFYDTDYLRHKGEYKIGETYGFALSALAFTADRVMADEFSYIMTDYEEDEMSEPVNEKDKESLRRLVVFAQNSGSCPDEANYRSPVLSGTQTVSFLKRKFYRLEINICLDREAGPIAIPLIARKDQFYDLPHCCPV